MLKITDNVLVTFKDGAQKMVHAQNLIGQHPKLLTIQKIAAALKEGTIQLFINQAEITGIRILPPHLNFKQILAKKVKGVVKPKKTPSSAGNCLDRLTQSFFSPYAYLKFGDYLVC